MKRGYNELVGLEVTLDRIIPRYSLTHHYRWWCNGQKETEGTLRSFNMRRHIPAAEILRNFRDAYAPAILSIWRLVTKGCLKEFYQFEVGARPDELGLLGPWEHWAEM